VRQGTTLSTVVLLLPPYDAVIVAATGAVTGPVAIVNVAVVAPAATVTVEGTLAAVALLPSTITAPPDGAGALSVTVPCVEVPPEIVATGIVSASSDAGAGDTFKVALRLVVPYSAVMTTSVGDATEDVVIVKAALVAPAATVTDAGVVAVDARLLEMAMTAPPGGAAGAMATAPCADDPPITVEGTIVIAVTPAGCGVSVNVAVTLAP
jgi:hypothetical protein